MSETIKGTAHGGGHQAQQAAKPDAAAKLTGDQQSALDRFRRIEQRDDRTAYAWLGMHGRQGSPMDYAYQALMATVGIDVINGYFNKYGQFGQGAAFGPGGSGRQGYVWGYHESGKGGDFATWETTFNHASTTLPPPDISAVVVDVT